MRANVCGKFFCGWVIVIAALLSDSASAGAANMPAHSHPGDYRTCSVCNAALQKSMGYLKNNLNERVLKNTWYAEMLGSFYAGFAFLMEGNSEKEAKQCAEHICKYFDWAERHGGYEGWFCSMSMMYLTEYSLRYGLTPEIAQKLEWGAKWAHKTREKEGGWFHGPRWGQGNYALDISSVGCGYFMSLEGMRVLGLKAGPALEEARDYVNQVCDGRSVAYGLYGKGGFSLGASSYVLIGLTSSGQNNDPRVAGIGDFLKQNYRDVRKAHASGMIHHFGVAAALHRVGPEAYGPFAGFYLHECLIPNMREDGSIGPLPNDNTGEAAAAYAPLKESSDYVATAILTAMILLERPGAFMPSAVKRQKTISNKDAYRTATEALAKNDLAKAYRFFAEVLPLGDSEELVPLAQAELKKIETPIRQRLKEIEAAEERDLAEAKSLADAKDYRAAMLLYDAVMKSYAALQKEYAGIPFVEETKIHLAELKKKMQPLVTSAAYSAGRSNSSSPKAPTATAEDVKTSSTAAISKSAASDDVMNEWSDRLRKRVLAVLGGGGKVRFEHKSFGQRMAATKMDDQGRMTATLEKGGQMDLRWEQLKPTELRSLSQDLAATQQTVGDYALAAFFEMQVGNSYGAEQLLLKAGAEAALVRKAFGESANSKGANP